MTRILKRKDFAKWQAGEKLPNAALCKAVKEMEGGLIDGAVLEGGDEGGDRTLEHAGGLARLLRTPWANPWDRRNDGPSGGSPNIATESFCRKPRRQRCPASLNLRKGAQPIIIIWKLLRVQSRPG